VTDLRQRFGRPLRLAMIGGGPSSWIGRTHHTAAELDGFWRVIGGVFASDPARSRPSGAALGFEAARCYGSVEEMIAGERKRPDGIEAVAIMTPNDTHYACAVAAIDAGLDVICDKPVTYDLREARDLAARVERRQRLFAITHGYSSYPMTRYAAHLVRESVLGALRLVQVEYIQSGLATALEEGPQTNRLRWVLDPKRSGLSLVMSAIGCHAQHLACSASGLDVTRVCADVGALWPGRKLIDYTSALCEFEGGVRGTFTATQAAAGSENDIRLRIYGEKGMLDWNHRDASYLRLALQGEPVRVVGRGDPWLPASILAAGRAPRGHPEGLREAFANIYAELAQERMALSLGEKAPPFLYPRIEDGVHTMAFIEACMASQAKRAWVDLEKRAAPRAS
jgi:predicted dehydrogenase